MELSSKKRLLVIVGLGVLAIPLMYILYVIYFHTYVENYIANTIYIPSSVRPDSDYVFHDLSPDPVPYIFEWRQPDRFFISGYVESQSLTDDKSLVIRVPTKKYPRGVKVKGYVQDAPQILTLKLEQGKYEGLQRWNLTPIEEIATHLIPGGQVKVQVVADKGKADSLVKIAEKKGMITVKPIVNITVGVFQ